MREVRKIKVRGDGEGIRVESENIVNSVCGEGEIRSIYPPFHYYLVQFLNIRA